MALVCSFLFTAHIENRLEELKFDDVYPNKFYICLGQCYIKRVRSTFFFFLCIESLSIVNETIQKELKQ